MPEPSSDTPGVMPSRGSIFAGSGDLATEMTRVADGNAHELDSLSHVDNDEDGRSAKKRLGPVFWIAAGWFILIALAALLAPILPLKSYTAPSAYIRKPPSAQFWFGTDTIGRDIFSRTVWGGRVSLAVAFASISFGVVVGGTIGIISGYFRGRIETFLMGFCDVLLSFPALLLALSIVAFRGDQRDLLTISLAIGVVSIAPVARLVRANTLVFAQREFVVAARSLGARNTRIIIREILPNVIFPVLSFSIIAIGLAVVAEGGLAFLGQSVQPPTPTWGGMISDGRSYLADAPWISLMPCLILFLTVLALNLAGDRIREYFDIKDNS